MFVESIIDRKAVPIILIQDVWNLGKKGDVVTVRTGYMRNCLVCLVIRELDKLVSWKVSCI